jgi:hypothetical protein
VGSPAITLIRTVEGVSRDIEQRLQAGEIVSQAQDMNIEKAASVHLKGRERLILALSIILYVVICCVSSISVSKIYGTFHVAYDSAELFDAALVVAAFSSVFLFFIFARFSFGYFIGFYFAAMVAGYLWLIFFSDRSYDHSAGRISAAASAFSFLLPALFVSSPVTRITAISVATFERMLACLFLISLATVAVAATYNFKFVSPADASSLRTDSFPAVLRYLIPITSSSLLPFLFACLVQRSAYWRAGAVLVLMLFYYPIAVSKVAFFAPVWLIVMSALARLFGARVTVVLSLLLPTLGGVILLCLFGHVDRFAHFAYAYFFNVNFRMSAVPSLAMDLYNDFFSKHGLTYFCQIGALKAIFGCHYDEQLSVVMLGYFPGGGAYNASLFATEGIASVGTVFAPISVFVCGLVIALGNRASAGLPASFILVSSAILVQVLLNVPLTTVLLTHGGVLLFVLWYLTPREIFEQARSNDDIVGPPPSARRGLSNQ